MHPALDPAANIYEGVWINWSRGSVWGLTWTLCPTQAVILTNSMAVFVTLAGVQLWTIVRYTIHHLGALRQSEVSSPFSQKEQLILRNADTAFATARLILNLAWNDRRSTGKRSVRAYSIGITALVYAVLFMAAGVFSNKAISASTINGSWEVLSRSENCGVWNQTYLDLVGNAIFQNENELEMFVQFGAKLAEDVQRSLEYAQECYLSDTSKNFMPSTCNSLRAPKVSWNTQKGSCPFTSDLCQNTTQSIIFDTGQIDSHDILGINAKPSERLKYRRVTTCAVLNNLDYVQGWDGTVVNSSSPKPPPETAFAYYGPSLYKETNWTYSYSNFASFYDEFSAEVTLPYNLGTATEWAPSDPQYSVDDFEALPALRQENADLTLFFLGFSGMYLQSIDDPWFLAQTPQPFDSPLPFLRTRFARDRAISTLGCVEKHSFCTNNGTCTDLQGFDQVQNDVTFNSALTPVQNVTFDRILRAVAFSVMGHIVENLSQTTTPLLASSLTTSGKSGAVISEPFPDNQWELELNYWHSIAMAQLQRIVSEYATGQIAPEPQHVAYLLQPTENKDIWFCNNFVVPSTIYQSFSVVAIILIVILGTLIIISSLIIESLVSLARQCLRKAPAPRAWYEDSLLSLRSSDFKRSSRPPRPPPKDFGYCPRPRRRWPSDEHELRHLSVSASERRRSSQALPLEDLSTSSDSRKSIWSIPIRMQYEQVAQPTVASRKLSSMARVNPLRLDVGRCKRTSITQSTPSNVRYQPPLPLSHNQQTETGEYFQSAVGKTTWI